MGEGEGGCDLFFNHGVTSNHIGQDADQSVADCRAVQCQRMGMVGSWGHFEDAVDSNVPRAGRGAGPDLLKCEGRLSKASKSSS